MSGGTFSVSRSIWKHEAFADEPMTEREAWLWMIGEAAWKPRVKRLGKYTADLERGQLIVSVRFLADAWGWSKSRVSRFILRLKNRDMLRSETGTGILIITICNYDEYQPYAVGNGTVAGQLAGQKRDSSGTNEKKEKKDIIPPIIPHGDDEEKSLDLHSQNPTAEDLYNIAAKTRGWPQARALSPQSRKKLNARIRELGGIEGWKDLLRTAGRSPHLCGRNDRGWTVSLPWLLSPTNVEKVMNGAYLVNGAREEHQRRTTPRSAVEQVLMEVGDGGDAKA